MSKKEESVLDVQEVYSKAERYIEQNKRSLAIILGAIIAIIGGYFAWKKLYMEPQEQEAQKQLFIAEQYFAKDSIDKAMHGTGAYMGFISIVDEYGLTKAANLAHYYLGICYLKKSKYEEAVEQLEEFDADDEMLAPMSKGLMGDAYMEMGKKEEAVSFYMKAANLRENNFTTPIYLMKAGLAYEDMGNYKNAVKIYEKIKLNYPDTNEGREIDKYLARAKTLMGTSS